MNIIETQKGIAKAWIPLEKIEPSALQQIYAMIEHPRLFKHVAIMPDVHAGIGATIGSVIPLEGAVIPSAVGVDIGCGMCSMKTNLQLEELKPHMAGIHDAIIRDIPRGFEHRTPSQKWAVHEFASKEVLSSLRDYEKLADDSLFSQLGTLGGGNHFIELQQDADGSIYVMLHSGSRNIGNKLAQIHIKKAKELANAPKDLEFFEEDSDNGKQYLKDMTFALNFARENRFIMMNVIKKILYTVFPDATFEPVINIHHNYAAKEKHFGSDVWIHRKGATHVTSDITGIIPGSMGHPSYLVRGKNNAESFNSCSHGAGRVMSRKKAKSELDIDMFTAQMEGIYSTSVDIHHLDEAPDAYKNIDEVMENQTDLVNVQLKLTPVLNIKG
jgi:tRNA-splicing ligase RtcB